MASLALDAPLLCFSFKPLIEATIGLEGSSMSSSELILSAGACGGELMLKVKLRLLVF